MCREGSVKARAQTPPNPSKPSGRLVPPGFAGAHRDGRGEGRSSPGPGAPLSCGWHTSRQLFTRHPHWVPLPPDQLPSWAAAACSQGA